METKQLGDYSVIKTIGTGSLGSVLLAEHRFMKRQFVLKLLPQELSQDRQFIQRFEEEIGALSQLDHPNIVKIHNISFTQDHFFLVTDCSVDELAETTNLAQCLRPQTLEEKEIYALLKKVAESLDYAHHKKNLVHRGLKLNNVLLGKGKSGGIEPFLSDFGLSKIIGSGLILNRTYKMVAESLQTQDVQKMNPLFNSFLQNYIFLSPEQKRLDHPHGVDYKADVYSFGVLAYYLLSKEYPEGIFDLPSSPQYNWGALIRACMQNDPKKRPESLSQAFEYLSKMVEKVQVAVPEMEHAVAGPGLKPIILKPHLERPTTDLDPAQSLIVDTTVKRYVPEKRNSDDIKPIPTNMISIQGGEFYRGASDGNRDEMPRHKVIIASFAIEIHPVTNEQFVRFIEAMGGEKDSNHNDIIRLRDSRIKRSAGRVLIESGYAKHPVVGVTWYGAVAYAKWVGKRLPTEAEWEIAARGGIESALYPSGEDIEKSQANFFSSDTTAVMSYVPNDFGLYDMAGNVYEWCQDWYGYNYYECSVQEPENPQGPIQGVYRVMRGGCWKSLKEDLRCSRRHRNNPGTVNGTYGFRCAADVE